MAAPVNINVTAKTPDKPATPSAQAAKAQGPSAVAGQSSGGKNPTCVGAQQAQQGAQAYPSTAGTHGQPGLSPPNVVMTFDVLEGTYNVLVGGGNGGDGGDGAVGATGAQGGNGAAASGPCGALPPAKGAKGADGGVGGIPGDGANGSYVTLYYGTLKSFTLNPQTAAGNGGNPGQGGRYGDGGSGGSDPGGTQGGSYDPTQFSDGPGQNGATGNGGQPGKSASFAGHVQAVYRPTST